MTYDDVPGWVEEGAFVVGDAPLQHGWASAWWLIRGDDFVYGGWRDTGDGDNYHEWVELPYEVPETGQMSLWPAPG